MPLESLPKENQEVTAQTAIANFLPNGRFAAGNKIHELSDKGQGRAKFATRISHILETKTANQIIAQAQDLEQLGIEVLTHRSVAAALTGDRQDKEFLIDRIEGKPTQKQELTGKDGGPLAIATADVSAMLLELSTKATED
jgi:hypothetical protein